MKRKAVLKTIDILLTWSFFFVNFDKKKNMIPIAHLHPMLVHFPIAIIMIGFLLDVFSFIFSSDKCLSRMGYYLEVIGMAAAIVAWGTGYFFTSPMEGEAGLAREMHEQFATITLISIIVATLFRMLIVYLKKESTVLRYVALLLYFIAFLSVSYTGFLGGRLVQDFMIGL
ncbi:MAG TPA: hypothetical protein PKJ28_03560 [Bacteroidales bacterium]|nr:hypothetical protein [Bacteroidales bacterium]HPS73180.1 hypothetical protein [Bacteroidales bacterium]